VAQGRPRLPREIYEVRSAEGLLFVGVSLAAFVGFGLLAAWVAARPWSLALRIVLAAPLLVLAAQGAHLLGFVGHEGIHLLLHRNKHVSMILGSLFSAMTSFSAVGYGIAHWNHHRYTNQASDPDARLYPQFRTFWTRCLFARSAGSRSHLRNTVQVALGRTLPLGYRLPFSAREQQVLAWCNLGFLAMWAILYLGLAYVNPWLALFTVVLPLALVVPMSGLRGYVEHAGTGIGVFRDSRSYASPFYTLLFYGNNFHLEHHLYPGVPCYRLAAVHRMLRDGGYYERWQSPVDATILGPLRHTTSASQYPSPADADLAYDPFADTPRGAAAPRGASAVPLPHA